MSNYARDLVDKLDAEIPGNPPELVRLYALLTLVKGEETALQDVHDAWALWRIDTRPDHPDLVPFDQLPIATQEYDRPYRDAIVKVSPPPRRMVRVPETAREEASCPMERCPECDVLNAHREGCSASAPGDTTQAEETEELRWREHEARVGGGYCGCEYPRLWPPAPASGDSPGWTPTGRTFDQPLVQPPSDLRHVRDCHGDVWRRLPNEMWHTPETVDCGWPYMVKKWGPLAEVRPALDTEEGGK